jgi:hypothetical protein
MLKFSEDAASRLPGLQAEILKAATILLPTYFLSNMAMPVMFVDMNDAGNVIRSKSKYEKKLQQYHLELAQGTFLTIPPEDARDVICHPHHIQEFSDKALRRLRFLPAFPIWGHQAIVPWRLVTTRRSSQRAIEALEYHAREL